MIERGASPSAPPLPASYASPSPTPFRGIDHVPRLNLALLAALAALAGILAACGSSPGSTAATASPTLTATATQAASSENALPSLDLPNDDAELEGLVPDEIDGSPLTKASMKGDNFLGQSSEGSAAAREFFQSIGVDPSQVSVAFGFSTTGSFVQIFRAPGADSEVLLDAYKQATEEAQDDPLDWQSANVGGKEVETATDPNNDQTLYLYGVGDLVIVISAPDQATAAEILSGMP
jgi:hypothetical protein